MIVSMRVLAAIALMAVTVVAVGALPVAGTPAARLPAAPPLSPAAKVGEKMFFDKSLSASGQLACAKRVAETAAVRTRADRDGRRWAGRRLGVTDGQAAGLLELADQLDKLPATKEASRPGSCRRNRRPRSPAPPALSPTPRRRCCRPPNVSRWAS